MTKCSPTYIQSNVYRTELFCLEVKCAQQMFTKMILLVELDRYWNKLLFFSFIGRLRYIIYVCQKS